MNSKYEKSEVVWAKIKGYPWWPAQVAEVLDNLYVVNFFCDNSHAKLKPEFLEKFLEAKEKNSKIKKNKKLQDAIKEANDYLIKNGLNASEQNIAKDSVNLEINNKTVEIGEINKSVEVKKVSVKQVKDKTVNKVNLTEIKNYENNKGKENIKFKESEKTELKGDENKLKVVLEELQNFPTPNFNKRQNNKKEEKEGNNVIINESNVIKIPNPLVSETDTVSNEDSQNKNITNENAYNQDINNINHTNNFDNSIVDIKKKSEIKPEIIIDMTELIKYSKEKKKIISNNTKLEEINEKKKKKEEENFLYQIDEYLYKIFDLFNQKKMECLDYEKTYILKVLLYLSKLKRNNFSEFLQKTNICKYVQYLTYYFQNYDKEISKMAKKAYRNFLIQFNKEFFKKPEK